MASSDPLEELDRWCDERRNAPTITTLGMIQAKIRELQAVDSAPAPSESPVSASLLAALKTLATKWRAESELRRVDWEYAAALLGCADELDAALAHADSPEPCGCRLGAPGITCPQHLAMVPKGAIDPAPPPTQERACYCGTGDGCIGQAQLLSGYRCVRDVGREVLESQSARPSREEER